MALFLLTRRFQKSNSRAFLTLLVQSRLLSSQVPLRSLSLFSSAFHRTLLRPSQTSSPCPSFQSFSAQSFNDPFEFEFVERRIHTPDPQETVLVDLLKRVAQFPSEAEAMASLDGSGIKANRNLVCTVIWELREEWRLAFLAFRWGEKWDCLSEKTCDLMIWVLGNHNKFNIAWCLIRDLHQSAMNIRRAMLIMIDRYAAANNPSKAIRTFYIMEKFRMSPDEEAFWTVLAALCQHGSIEEAEEFMHGNKKLFPLQTVGFNIILNGWCNISVDVLEAKRVWREMSKCCVTPDATTYTHMISSFSKVGNLFDSLRLYDEMKKRGLMPSPKVYNSLVYVLTHKNCFNQALNILEKMKETGIQPDSATYNSIIRPLCELEKVEEARTMLATMIKENITPTTETYHSLLEAVGFEGKLEILQQMRTAGLGPCGKTFLLILNKLFKLKETENALKIWAEMKQFDVVAESNHYMVLVQGLARCGWITKARDFYDEMSSRGIFIDPKLKKLMKEQDGRKNEKKNCAVRQVKRSKQVNLCKGSEKSLKNSRRRSKKKTLNQKFV